MSPDAPRELDAELDTLTVMTFNIRSGRASSLEAIAAVINDAKPEIVALQEVDVDTMRTGMVNQPHRLSQLTGMASRSGRRFRMRVAPTASPCCRSIRSCRRRARR